MQIGDRVYRNFINFNYKVVDENFCDQLAEYYNLNSKKTYDSRVATGDEKFPDGEIKKAERNSREFIPWGEGMMMKIRNIVNPLVEDYIQHYPEITASMQKNTWYEPAHILKYEKSKDYYYNFHVDKFEKGGNDRIISIIIYLNDVAEGGGTEFKYFEPSVIQPSKGSVLIFPSTSFWMHKGVAPISNEKLICVSWLRNRDVVDG